MTKYRNLDTGDVLPASWTDAIQEFVGTLTSNLRLTLSAANVVQAAAGTDTAQASVGLGLWRYRTSAATATVSGAAGTKDIYVVASANAFAVTPSPDTDNTDYNWYLQVLGSGVTPTGNTPAGAPITAYRKVGELRWDGTTNVTLLRQMVGSGDSTASISPTSTQVAQVTARFIGATSQTANLLEAGIGLTGANVFSVSAGGTVNAAAYQVGGVALAASNLSNGTTGTGSVALAASPALTGTPTAPTAAVDTNTTQVATTAYVVGQGYLKSATAASTYLTQANAASTYLTQATASSTYAPLASPTLTGTPTAPTASGATNNTQIATTAYVQTAVANATNNGATTSSPNIFTATQTFQGAAVGDAAWQVRTTAEANPRIRATAGGVLEFGPGGATATDITLARSGTATLTVANAAGTAGTLNVRTGFQVNGTPLAASHLSNGTTGTGSVVLAASPALTGTPTAPTAAADTNTTQIATTAFVIGQGYAKLASPTLTGTPLAPTAAADTNTTQIATTAFVMNQAASASPLMDGSAAVGTSLRYARGDHVHPTDTSRAPLASPTFTGTPAAPTAAAGTNTTQIATTAFVAAGLALKANLASPTFTGTVTMGAATTGTITANGNTVGKAVRREQHTWAIVGQASAGTLPAMACDVPAGESLASVRIRHRVRTGTSCTFDLRRTVSGSESTLVSGIVATTTLSTTAAAVALADLDLVYPVVTAVSGAPTDVTITLGMDRTVAA